MTVEKHPHGTSARYAHGPAGDGVDPCRGACCREAHNASARRRHRLRAYQRPTMVDAAPVRAHVLELREAGIGSARVEELSGVSRNVMSRLLYGRPSTGEAPSRTVNAASASAILAVRPGPEAVAAGAPVPAHGTRRRLQALVARGWGIAELARRLGWHRTHLHHAVHGHSGVTANTARRVRDLYDELWDQPPPASTRQERNARSRALNLAEQYRWAVPMQWDDDDLDRAEARPAGQVRDFVLERDVKRLDGDGLGVAAIAARLGRSRGTVQKVRDRIRREREAAA